MQTLAPLEPHRYYRRFLTAPKDMSPSQLLTRVKRDECVAFDEAIRVINQHYDYQPTAFSNGPIHNDAGQNEGSCRIFAFARLHDLTVEQTLALFGEHYREVSSDPQGSGHANIRAFMKNGWSGIVFDGIPLTPKTV